MPPSPELLGKRKLVQNTWVQRCCAIYFLLHPNICNGNATKASHILGIPRSTLLSWVSCSVKNNVVSKWYFLLEKMTWADVRSHFTPEITKNYMAIPDDSKINLSKFKPLRGDNVILSKFCGVPLNARNQQEQVLMPKPEGKIPQLVSSPWLISVTECRSEIEDQKIPR